MPAKQSAEDLAQETYLRAIRSAPNFRGESGVRTWLLAIARNVCADYVRRKQRQRRLVNRLAPSAQATRPAEDLSTHRLLNTLPADRREAFVLTQVLGASHEEAAQIMGCAIGTIRSRVARARADLMTAVREAEAQ